MIEPVLTFFNQFFQKKKPPKRAITHMCACNMKANRECIKECLKSPSKCPGCDSSGKCTSACEDGGIKDSNWSTQAN